MNAIGKYFKYRQSLIDQYVKGDMTKSEYLAKNLDAVLSMSIGPFQNVDTVEKGLFNYHYYNALAKEASMQSHLYNDKNLGHQYIDKSDYYYEKKDKNTLRVLRLLDFRGVDAYFIKVRSKFLKGKLFEIVLIDYEMILHSANPFILKRLKDESVFEETIKKSLIDGYINQKY